MIMTVVSGWHRVTTFLTRPKRLVRGEQGASLVEYALLLALIVIVCVVAIQFLGTSTSSGLSNAGSYLSP